MLDSIIEHGKISSEFAALLDSVAQQFEAWEDELIAVTEERDNAIESLDQSEDEIVQLEDRIVELEDKVENLEKDLKEFVDSQPPI